MSADVTYRAALYRAAQQAKKHRGHPVETCKHWYVKVKHPCGPATEVCQDCGHERAL